MNLKKQNVAIHFHVPVYVEGNFIFAPFYFGIWVDEISKNFSKTYLITYTSSKKTSDLNYKFNAKKFVVIDLGQKKKLAHVYYYAFFYKFKLKEIINNVDFFIYRAPSPLVTHFLRMSRKKKNIILLVANNIKTIEAIKLSNPVKYFIWKLFWTFDNFILSLLAKQCLVMSNGPGFINDFKKIKNQNIIFTSTVTDKSVIKKALTRPILPQAPRLLFVGRLSPEKGIDILINAISLNKVPVFSELVIVGSGDLTYESALKSQVPNCLRDMIKFLGHVNSQERIFDLMDNSDLLIIPSKWDFQPRITWESLSRGLPIICSDSIESLHIQFSQRKAIKFFKTGEAKSLRDAICNFSSELNLDSIYVDAYQIAKARTIQQSIQLQIDLINSYAFQ